MKFKKGKRRLFPSLEEETTQFLESENYQFWECSARPKAETKVIDWDWYYPEVVGFGELKGLEERIRERLTDDL